MESKSENSRQIGLTGAICLVVANMIGTGIFTTTGFLLADMPSREAILSAWLVGGIIAMLGAICYGALARVLPESGGEYYFLSRTIHPAVGYVEGWISLLVGFSAPIAAAAFALGEYTKSWFPMGVSPKWIGTAAMLFFALIHTFKIKHGLRIQNAIVILKILLISSFIGVACSKMTPDATPLESSIPTGAFLSSLVWVYFGYSGWNAAVYIGGEVVNPKKNIPRAMLIGTAIVTLLYLSLNVIFLFAAPPQELAGQVDVARIAARSIAGNGFAEFTTVLIVVALLTSISGMMMTGPRVYSKMAEDGFLPKCFHSNLPPATHSVHLQLSVSLLMLWIPNFPDLVKYIGFTLGIGSALTVIGMMKLKIQQPENLQIIGWPWVPLLFLASIGGVTFFSILHEPKTVFFGLLTIVLGIAAWWIQSRNR